MNPAVTSITSKTSKTSETSETSETSKTADDPDRHSVRDLLLLPGAARQSGTHAGRWASDRPSNRRGDRRGTPQRLAHGGFLLGRLSLSRRPRPAVRRAGSGRRAGPRCPAADLAPQP